jgi:hypothetical protein
MTAVGTNATNRTSALMSDLEGATADEMFRKFTPPRRGGNPLPVAQGARAASAGDIPRDTVAPDSHRDAWREDLQAGA